MSLTKFDQARLDGYQGTLLEFASKAFRDGGILAARSVGFDGAEADLVALVTSEDAAIEKRIREEQAHADLRAEVVRSMMSDADFVSAITGTDGLDAFELAQSKGFDGELQDWLASLSGVDGSSAYEIALQRGYDGTEDEWLKALVGLDGMSAYDLWVSVGNNGSMSDFLSSLKGEKGDKGDKGERGEKGDRGDKGDMGDMPAHQWEGTRIRFMQPDGRWGQWVDLKGAMGASSSGGGGAGSLSIQKFYDSQDDFPEVGKPQILYFDKSTDPYSVFVWDGVAYQQVGGGGSSAQDTFERVSKNLRSVDFVLSYADGELTTLTYADGIVKTLNYTAGELTSVVLSGATPAGIDLTKTLTYASGELVGVTYS